MQLDELRWFVALAEAQHVTDAAAELGVTQPTLSRALGRWEAEFGVPLFDRVNRRLRLNPDGAILLEHARRAVAEMRAAAERIAANDDPDTGTVRLGFLHSQATWYVPDLLRRFRIEAPRVRFELYQGAAYDMVSRLDEALLDLAIIGPRPDGSAHRWRPLYSERLCLAVPRTHPLAGRARVSLADAGADPFVVMRTGYGMRALTDGLFDAAGISPDHVFEATELTTVEGLVAAGFGVAVVPEPRPGRAEPQAAYLPLTDAGARRHIGLIWARDRPLTPAADRFAHFLRDASAAETDRSPG